MSNIQVVIEDIYSVRPTFAQVLADPSINFEREAGFAIQALQGNDYALGVAAKNRQSVVDAITNLAAIGISLNPAKKQAYLVPRDGKICLDISYMGLIDLAVECGAIAWAQANVVHEQDQFELTGYDRPPVHKYQPFGRERGEPIGVYVVVKTMGGDYLTHTMSVDEVNAIRDRSSAWKAWVKDKRKCPWVTDYAEMTKKTCVKQAYKYWPRGAKSSRLETAIHHLNTEAGEGLADLQQQAATNALPPYDDAKFQHNLNGAWKRRVDEGGDPDDLLAMLQTRNSLTPKQVQAIKNLAPIDVDATQPATQE